MLSGAKTSTRKHLSLSSWDKHGIFKTVQTLPEKHIFENFTAWGRVDRIHPLSMRYDKNTIMEIIPNLLKTVFQNFLNSWLEYSFSRYYSPPPPILLLIFAMCKKYFWWEKLEGAGEFYLGILNGGNETKGRTFEMSGGIGRENVQCLEEQPFASSTNKKSGDISHKFLSK